MPLALVRPSWICQGADRDGDTQRVTITLPSQGNSFDLDVFNIQVDGYPRLDEGEEWPIYFEFKCALKGVDVARNKRRKLQKNGESIAEILPDLAVVHIYSNRAMIEIYTTTMVDGHEDYTLKETFNYERLTLIPQVLRRLSR